MARDLSKVALEAALGGTDAKTRNFTQNNVLADNDDLTAALDKVDKQFRPLILTPGNEGAGAGNAIDVVCAGPNSGQFLASMLAVDGETTIADFTITMIADGTAVFGDGKARLLFTLSVTGSATIRVTDATGALDGDGLLVIAPASNSAVAPAGSGAVAKLTFA